MRLAVSSIAWTNEEDEAVAQALRELGVTAIEVAPTKKWSNPTIAPADEVAAYRKFWESYGLEVVAFQSMLFNELELKIFVSEENRAKTLAYLSEFTRLAGDMGAKVLVFGSPKNRQKGDMDSDQADQVAVEFFTAIGSAAQRNNTKFCIEPNPTDYACDFVTNAQAGIDIVQRVNNPGFGLHLDIAGMTLAHDDIAASITAAAPVLSHFHISAPYLEQVKEGTGVDHQAAAEALQAINYDKVVSIEMRPAAAGENVARVVEAVKFAQSVYSV